MRYGEITRESFGALPRVSAVGDLPVFDDDWLIPEDRWEGLISQGCGDLSYGVVYILNQNPKGWCWTFSAAGCVMVVRRMHGHATELLLPDAAAAYLKVSGGYPIDSVLNEFVLPIGYPPATVAPKANPLAYNNRITRVSDMAANWRDLAGQRKPLAARDCPTAAHVVSAILHGWPVEAGIFWEDSPAGGHALCCCKLEWRNKQVYLAGPNSWGRDYTGGWFYHPDLPGWFSVPLSKWDIGTFGAFALMDAEWSPEDGKLPALRRAA